MSGFPLVGLNVRSTAVCSLIISEELDNIFSSHARIVPAHSVALLKKRHDDSADPEVDPVDRGQACSTPPLTMPPRARLPLFSSHARIVTPLGRSHVNASVEFGRIC